MLSLAFLQNIGPTELIIVLAIILLLFGATQVPRLARSLGKSANEFKKGLKEGAEEDEPKDETRDASKD